MKTILAFCMLLLTINGLTQGPVRKPVGESKVIINKSPVITTKTGDTKVTSKLSTKPSASYQLNNNARNLFAGYTTHTQTINGKTIRSKMVPVNGGLQPVTVTRAKQVGVSQKIKETASSNNNGQYCQTYSVKVSANSEDFDVPYGTAASHIYPGAAYMYEEYYKNTVSPKSITLERNPIYIQAASSSGNGKFELVENPTQVNLNAAVGRVKGSLPASATNESTSIKMISLYDAADFYLKVNGGGGGFGFKADASFGISTNSRKTYFLIDAVQTFYTLNAMPPENAATSFFKDPANDKLNGALFMASVSYGRRVLGVLETEFKDEKMFASFKASYTNGVAGGYADLNMINGMNSQTTKVKLYFVGGNASSIEVPNATESSVRDAINNYLRTTNSQNAVPVKFTFRNMAMSGMRYESATDNFTYQQCVPIAPELKYNVNVKLVMIENSKNEEVKFGIKQYADLYSHNKRIVTRGNETAAFLCWMAVGEPMKSLFKAEEPRSFTGNTTINRAVNYQLLQSEMMAGAARIELRTDYIAMYATKVFGSTNDANPKTNEIVYLKDVITSSGGSVNKDIQINFNGRVFTLHFTITATPM